VALGWIDAGATCSQSRVERACDASRRRDRGQPRRRGGPGGLEPRGRGACDPRHGPRRCRAIRVGPGPLRRGARDGPRRHDRGRAGSWRPRRWRLGAHARGRGGTRGRERGRHGERTRSLRARQHGAHRSRRDRAGERGRSLRDVELHARGDGCARHVDPAERWLRRRPRRDRLTSTGRAPGRPRRRVDGNHRRR
jgi:hypothetical protein